jgi:HlyD family secretion protein
MGYSIWPKDKVAILAAVCLSGVAVSLALLAPRMAAQETVGQVSAEPPDDKRWQAVAPGRVEPVSGEIKIASVVAGRIGEVLVRANDKVFAGEPLVRLVDDEAQQRLASAQAQVALRRRARNDETAPSRAAARRRAEDAVADAEGAVLEARDALDKAAAERHAGRASDADVTSAVAALARTQDRLKQAKADLRKIEADATTPLPTQAEGQLNIARADWLLAEAAVGKLTIRAPVAGSILQVNAKAGELSLPSGAQPLVVLGDVSALRVRAELDERDYGEIKLGQAVTVRPAAFRGREVGGKVSFIAPLVEPARNSARSQRNVTDVDVVEILADLAQPGPLAVGMKVDVYFRQDTARQ